MSSLLRERRLVGSSRTLPPLREGVFQHTPCERLRRLREPDARPIQRAFHDVSILARPGGKLHRIVGRDRRNRGTRRRCGGDRAIDEVGVDQRPRRIVDHDEIRQRPDRGKCVGDRILPALTACHHTQRLRRAAEERGRRRCQVGWQRDHDLVYTRMVQEGADAALEHRAAADFDQLFRSRAAKPAARPASGHDGCNVHASSRSRPNGKLYDCG